MRAPRSAGLAIALALVSSAPGARAEAPSTRAAEVVARALADALAAQDGGAAAALCALPVSLDGERVTSPDRLALAWREALSRPALRGARRLSVDLLAMSEALARFGPAPARLGPLPADALVAVIRMDRTQLVAVLAWTDDRWAVVAVTD